jgi:hypothetical protein
LSFRPYHFWMISAGIGAVSGLIHSWSIGVWWCLGGFVFGFSCGLVVAMICSFPYLLLLIYVQKNMPNIESTVSKFLYFPQVILGMVLAWYVPSWCLTSVAAEFTR